MGGRHSRHRQQTHVVTKPDPVQQQQLQQTQVQAQQLAQQTQQLAQNIQQVQAQVQPNPQNYQQAQEQAFIAFVNNIQKLNFT